jgi:chromate transport protein ChrA
VLRLGILHAALSYGGGFVIVPLMQHDAVAYHWMTSSPWSATPPLASAEHS